MQNQSAAKIAIISKASAAIPGCSVDVLDPAEGEAVAIGFCWGMVLLPARCLTDPQEHVPFPQAILATVSHIRIGLATVSAV